MVKAYRQSPAFKEQIRKRDDYRCQICDCTVGDVCDWHYAPVTQIDVAHIVPWPDGDSTPENMRVLCHPCNKREGQGRKREPVVSGARYESWA